eukprot:1681729-Prymnesium_polylepis.1
MLKDALSNARMLATHGAPIGSCGGVVVGPDGGRATSGKPRCGWCKVHQDQKSLDLSERSNRCAGRFVHVFAATRSRR